METDPSVIGIHLEGPFLSPEKPGVHAVRHIRRPTADDLAMLTAPRRGVLLATLAPEQVPPGFIRQLVTRRGPRFAGALDGHLCRNASGHEGRLGRLHASVQCHAPDCRPRTGTDPGGRGNHAMLGIGMIVDGVHVDPANLQLALRGAATPMLVTDAMPPVGGAGPGFSLYGDDITVSEGRCVRARWRSRRIPARHGHRGPQLRSAPANSTGTRFAVCVDASRKIFRARSMAGPAGSRLPRRHGGHRSNHGSSVANLGRRP